ncbi:unnamed protein product [Effrenium voratum]|uniref:C2 domain-containing protein n=1 Tax=Effrenium voratum TaxID=2562239 RepID=A0AA36IX69_9DINO|nr:unnamed protein product [Effrenium voratum]CAJ1423826.1 unnamed protein product [Effrenium voratum]
MGCAQSRAAGAALHPKLLGRSESGKAKVVSESIPEARLETFLVLRVLRADLLRSFDAYGKMDPFTVVEWLDRRGSRKEISRTRIDWNADLHPHWDHTCRGQPFKLGSEDEVEFQVLEGNVIGRPTFCGAARVTVDELLPTNFSMEGTSAGPVTELELRLSAELTGHVFVQALLVASADRSDERLRLTKVDPVMFEGPIERLGVSGGSAAFFKLRLKGSRPPDYFIGKDLSHAEDEVTFYEEALSLRRRPGSAGLGQLLGYTLEYAGVLSSTEETPSGEKKTELLVMRNLRSGCAKLRLLDIKIGQKTAQAGWQGKSRAAALRQSVVDGVTNSSCEGFRLEGFDGRPPALESMDPLLDLGMTGNAKMAKKALRVMLQRMTAAEMLLHWLDVHQEPADIEDGQLTSRICTAELAELACHEAVRQLCGLAVACRRSPVPQKWIGSSVGLSFDASLPKRSTAQEEVRKSTLVCTFDWGRSELNTIDKHMLMSEKDQLDRGEFWRYYMGGIDRLAWEAARAYRHRFSCKKWSLLTFKVCDFDSMSENDFIGRLTVPVEETPERTADLTSKDGNHVVGENAWRGSASLTFSITWRRYPKPSRLLGAWRVQLKRAQHLPRQDKMQLRTTSDPMCEITACAEDPNGLLCLRQVSSVKVRHLDPEWNEVFDLPVLEEDYLEQALEGAAPGLGQDLQGLFPPEKMPSWMRDQMNPQTRSPGRSSSFSRSSNSETEVLERALEGWKTRLDAASSTELTPSASARSPTRSVGSPTRTAVPEQQGVNRETTAATVATAATTEPGEAEPDDTRWIVRVIPEEARTGHREIPALRRIGDSEAREEDDGPAHEAGIVTACRTDYEPDGPPAMTPIRTVDEREAQRAMCWDFSCACMPT